MRNRFLSWMKAVFQNVQDASFFYRFWTPDKTVWIFLVWLGILLWIRANDPALWATLRLENLQQTQYCEHHMCGK